MSQGISAWVLRMIGWLTPPEHREVYLGDVAEEWARRRACGVAADRWLISELWSGLGVWVRYRGRRSDIVEDLVVCGVAFSAALVVLEVANRPPVLDSVRSMGGVGRSVVLWGVNLGALTLGGALVALARGRQGHRAAAGLVALAWMYPVFFLGPAYLAVADSLAVVAWGAAVAVAIATGFVVTSCGLSMVEGRRPA